jgi:hypothetical protein
MSLKNDRNPFYWALQFHWEDIKKDKKDSELLMQDEINSALLSFIFFILGMVLKCKN